MIVAAAAVRGGYRYLSRRSASVPPGNLSSGVARRVKEELDSVGLNFIAGVAQNSAGIELTKYTREVAT